MIKCLLAGSLALQLACAASPPASTKAAPTEAAASAGSNDPERADAGERASAEPLPTGRLPADVRPTRYALALTVVPERDRFAGAVDITLHLDRARRVLWLHGLGFQLTAATLATPGSAAVPVKVEEADPTGVLRVSLPAAIGPGEATLHVEWDAPWNTQLVGLYRARVGERWFAFTKLEPIHARKIFPCFDEPAFKAPLSLTLTVPQGAVAVSNSLPAAEEPAGPGLRTVRFAPTAPLPTYLYALAVGDLQLVERTLPAGGPRTRPLAVRGVAVRGRAAELGFALDATARLVPLLEAYFDLAYPYDKLDLVAVPDFVSGAMENAGAIFFREEALLVDEARAPLRQRIGVVSVTAHELAHQWFGDLVTMPWWDDIWLNEAFATFLATRVLREGWPTFQAELDEVQAVSGAMEQDSLASARSVRQPIATTHDIENGFDGITYEKGAGVLAMFERWLGKDVFRAGLRQFLAAHQGGTATTDDLLAALSAAAGRDVAAPFHTFLDQPGVPLVTVKLENETLTLEQSRYTPLGSPPLPAQVWQLPVCVRSASSDDNFCTLLTEPTARHELGGAGATPLPDADGAGYLRWTAPPEVLRRLAKSSGRLAATERLSLAQNLEAAVRSGALPVAEALAALQPIADDPEGAVARQPARLLSFVLDELAGAQRPAAERYAAALYSKRFAALGWTPAEDEPPARRRLRAELARFLTLEVREPAASRAAAALGRTWIAGARAPAAKRPKVPPDLVPTALAAAVRADGAPAFDALLAALRASENAEERGEILSALGSTRDPALGLRARELVFDDGLRVNERTHALREQLAMPETRAEAWRWLQARFDALVPRVPERAAANAPRFVQLCDAASAAEVQAFFAERSRHLLGGPRNLANAVQTIKLCAAQAEGQRESAQGFLARVR